MRIMKEILIVSTRPNPGREKINAEIPAFLGVISHYEKKKKIESIDSTIVH